MKINWGVIIFLAFPILYTVGFVLQSTVNTCDGIANREFDKRYEESCRDLTGKADCYLPSDAYYEIKSNREEKIASCRQARDYRDSYQNR